MAEAAIKERAEKFITAFIQKDVAGTMAFYTEDSIMLPYSGKEAKGIAAITETVKKLIEEIPGEGMTFEIVETQMLAPDVGFSRAYYTARSGKYKDVLTWKKTDGEWYCLIDIANLLG